MGERKGWGNGKEELKEGGTERRNGKEEMKGGNERRGELKGWGN